MRGLSDDMRGQIASIARGAAVGVLCCVGICVIIFNYSMAPPVLYLLLTACLICSGARWPSTGSDASSRGATPWSSGALEQQSSLLTVEEG